MGEQDRDREQRQAQEPRLIEQSDELAAMVAELSSEPVIGLDLEGDGLYRYRSRLCMLQLSVGDRIWLVDTLKIWEPRLWADLLGPQGPLKIIHDAAYDARLLREWGVQLGNVFDTSVAARFLGEPATGLASLVGNRCGASLSKGQQKADWGKRPLGSEAFEYLAQDVRHLFALQSSLCEDVERLGIEDEVREECRYVLAQAQVVPPVRPAWSRVKGFRDLEPTERAIMAELVELRELAAQDWDVPPFKVVGDPVLLALAALRPKSRSDLGKLARPLPGRARRLTDDLLKAVARGLSGEPPELEHSEPPSREERALRRTRERSLNRWRKQEAAERGVDVQVILPGHCLQDLLRLAPGDLKELEAVAGLGAGRRERYGDILLERLNNASEDYQE